MYGLGRRRTDQLVIHGTAPVCTGRTERDIEKVSGETLYEIGVEKPEYALADRLRPTVTREDTVGSL